MIYEKELEKYSQSVSEKSRNKQTARFRAFLTWLSPRQPTKENVQKYIRHLQKRYEDGSIRQDLAIIRKGFRVNNWDWPLLSRGELPVVREKHVRRPTLAYNLVSQMIDVVLGLAPAQGPIPPNEQHQCFLCAATIWGCRPIELTEIQDHWLDINNKTIFIQTAKEGRQRYHLIPDFAIPYLQGWGFQRKLSDSYLGRLMSEMKVMVGFTGPSAYGAGWHALRRSCIRAAQDVGFMPHEVHNFYRWKVATESMPLRYASGTWVGDESDAAALPFDDKGLDERIYEKHPFCIMWREKIARLEDA